MEEPSVSAEPSAAETSPEATQDVMGDEPDTSAEPSPSPTVYGGIISVDTGGKASEVETFMAKGSLRANPSLDFEMNIASGLFEELAQNNVFKYVYTNDESGDTFIEVSLKEDASADELAPSFLSDYIDFTNIEFSSYTKVGKDGLSGYKITADNDKLYTEAYLINTGGDTAAVVICCGKNYKIDSLPYMKAMLGTLILEES